MEGQLTKILVERDDDAVLTLRTLKDLDIATAWRIGAHPGHIVAPRPQRGYCLSRKILVCQKAINLARSISARL